MGETTIIEVTVKDGGGAIFTTKPSRRSSIIREQGANLEAAKEAENKGAQRVAGDGKRGQHINHEQMSMEPLEETQTNEDGSHTRKDSYIVNNIN